MAEVEKVPAATAAVTATAADIPVTKDIAGDLKDGTDNIELVDGGIELAASPTQDPSSNSHPHDSEYDTASDLDGSDDDYEDDDDEDLDDETESSSDDDDDEDDDDEEDDDREPGQSDPIDKAEDEAKKVDEDRSNPQYIPKRGTFYEHDDRTADVGEEGDAVNGEVSADGKDASGKAQNATISQASKTMKKWQQAERGDRWSHDRFNENEQAPKSRSELVNSYGYDIRTEDAPPRARRRRRYGRGPTKYSRNWEDENAYLKASNKERKAPPRPSDFPALNERAGKPRPNRRSGGEEKENHLERRSEGGTNAEPQGPRSHRDRDPDDRRERRNRNDRGERIERGERSERHERGDRGDRGERGDRADRGDRIDRGDRSANKKGYNRNAAAGGRQPPMEFKQKNRNLHNQAPHANNRDQPLHRPDGQHDRQGPRNNERGSQNSGHDGHKAGSFGKGQYGQPKNGQVQADGYSNNKQDGGYHQQQQQQHPGQPLQGGSTTAQRQNLAPKTMSGSNLSQRLQQAQNRNDPSHVGSVQIHSLASNQQQQQTANHLMSPSQQQQQMQVPPQQHQQIPQEQRGPPKRYSSMRRSQHDSQHIPDHQLQQLHLQQQQQQQQQQAGPLLIQDPQLMQANLMHMYPQDGNLVSMQGLHISQPPPQGPSKQPAYATVPPSAQAQPTPAAYYVAADPYAANASGPPAAPAPAQYATPAPANTYMPAAAGVPPAGAIGYATAPVPAGPGPAGYGGAAPVTPPTVVPGAAAAAPNAPGAAGSYPNYQNYPSTVGGTTYFVPPVQPPSRPAALPQRRPTNAIPILPPSEKSKQRSAAAAEAKDDPKSAPIGSAENIDHIIDNMFVQRPAFQPPQASAGTAAQSRKSASPPAVGETVAAASDSVVGSESSEQVATAKVHNEEPEKVSGGGGAETPQTGESTPIESNSNGTSSTGQD